MSLGVYKPFVNFDLELSPEEYNCLSQLHIICTSHYENYGELDLLSAEIRHFIKAIGKNSDHIAQTVSQLITKLAYRITAYTEHETALLWDSITSTISFTLSLGSLLSLNIIISVSS